jgi:hypothetical protein
LLPDELDRIAAGGFFGRIGLLLLICVVWIICYASAQATITQRLRSAIAPPKPRAADRQRSIEGS